MPDDVVLNKAATIERCLARIRDAFELLEKAGLLEGAIAQRMTRMVGFRNIAVHDYTKLNMAVVKSIITERLGDFTAFTHRMLTL